MPYRHGKKHRGGAKQGKTSETISGVREKHRGLLGGDEYAFLDENPLLAANIDSIFMGGSRAYGLDTASSDTDIRGFATRDARSILRGDDFGTVTDAETDTTIHSFDKFVRLLADCNPNIVEFLGLSADSYLNVGEAGRAVLAAKDAFLSKKAAATFGGYATAQFVRLRNAVGRNIGTDEARIESAKRSLEHGLSSFSKMYSSVEDGRAAISVNENRDGNSQLLVDIEMSGVSIAEASDMLARMTSIAKSHDSMNGRNRKKDTAHLAKHMSHLLRLYHMGEEILSGKGVITNRSDAGDAELLMEVKLGKYMSEDGTEVDDEFFELVDEAKARFYEAERKTRLPDKPDWEKIWKIVEDTNRRIVVKSR